MRGCWIVVVGLPGASRSLGVRVNRKMGAAGARPPAMGLEEEEEEVWRKGLGHAARQGSPGFSCAGEDISRSVASRFSTSIVLVRLHPERRPVLHLSWQGEAGRGSLSQLEDEQGGFAWRGREEAEEGPWWWSSAGPHREGAARLFFFPGWTWGERSSHDWLEVVRPLLRWKGVVLITRVTFWRNRRHGCRLPHHWSSSRAIPWPWGRVSIGAGTGWGAGLYLQAVV